MGYTDSHIHLQDYKPQDVKNVVTNAVKNKVTTFVNASAHPNDWPAIEELADTYSGIIPAFGVHPWYIDDIPPNWLQELEKLLQKYPQAFIGECGIDRLKNPQTERQLQILLPHIELAQRYKRPLIIHAVRADAIFTGLLSQLPPQTVFHSYTGSIEWGKKLQSAGFYLGLNFSVLRKKNSLELINNLDLNHILVETDGPYQSGQPNEPSLPEDLPQLAEHIAAARNMTTMELQNILSANWHRFTGE